MPAAATTDWLPGFEKIDVGPDGGTWADQTYPWRGVWHTTEGGWDASISSFRSKRIPPHLLVDPVTRRRGQLVSLNRSSYALENDPGGVETNREHAIQIEVVGYARQSHLLADDALRWLGEEVVRPLAAAVPIRFWSPPFYGEGAGWTLATESARQRMSFEAWRSFDGWCGHQHVPENAHWDPGALNVARILDFARPTTPEEATTMGYVHAEILDGTKGPWPGGRFTFFAVTAKGQVDVFNDVSALDGKSDVWKGDARGLDLVSPIVAFAQTPGGRGYWLVSADGGVFTYGDARFFGSMAGKPLAAPVIGIAPRLTTGRVAGYVLLAADGGCFNFGDVDG